MNTFIRYFIKTLFFLFIFTSAGWVNAESWDSSTWSIVIPMESNLVISQDGKKLWLFSTMDLIDSIEIKITETQWSIQLLEGVMQQTNEKVTALDISYKSWKNTLSSLKSTQTQSWVIDLNLINKLPESLQVMTQDLVSQLELEFQAAEITNLEDVFRIEERITESYELKNNELEILLETQEMKMKNLLQSLEIFQDELILQQKLLRELYKNQWNNLAQLLLILAIIFLFSHSTRWIIHSRTKLSDDKKNVLAWAVRWITNSAFVTVIAVFFFSELLNFLPFVAILGTAIGFALRDIISSFIAWFLIGHKDSVYKLWDVIEVEWDNVFGRVFKISPVVTTIQELGLSGPSGMYKTFPNKAVFEKSIKNISKINGWIYITIDIILDKTSSITLSKKILLESMQHVLQDDKYSSPADSRAPFKRYWITEDHMHPEIFLDIKPQGIFLRWKVFVYWPERHWVRSDIVELFFECSQKEKSVVIKQLEIG